MKGKKNLNCFNSVIICGHLGFYTWSCLNYLKLLELIPKKQRCRAILHLFKNKVGFLSFYAKFILFRLFSNVYISCIICDNLLLKLDLFKSVGQLQTVIELQISLYCLHFKKINFTVFNKFADEDLKAENSKTLYFFQLQINTCVRYFSL